MNEPAKTCPQCHAPMPEGSTSSLCAKCLLQVGFETDCGPTADSESQAYQPTFIAPTIDELAPSFPQLEILEQIGHGGMGVVYKARQKELDRIVALKILRPNISTDASFAERFQREARALAKLNHPNIITIYDFGRKDGLFFFIMEFVDGTNLRHVERTGQLSPQEALSIVPQVCSALQYAHDNGVVHRDIKPENILVTKSGDVRIADFGLAKLAGIKDEVPLTGTWQVMGTPHYMAPEQFEKPTTVDHRADIYSLGVVIYELLTGELPLGRFLLPSEKVRIDVRLDEVVLKSLAKEPERRYQRVTDVATAVSDASSVPPAEKRFRRPDFRVRMKRDLKHAWITGRNKLPGLHIYRHGLGTILMCVSAIDVLISLCFLCDQPSNNVLEFMSCSGILAGSVAFWLGRQYPRNSVSTLLWYAAIVSIPWLSPLVIFSLARMGLTALILCIQSGLSQNTPSDPDGNDDSKPPAPDFIDKAIIAFRKARSVVTPRILLLTLFGTAGWCLVWGLPTVGIGMLWFSPYSAGHSLRPHGFRAADMALFGIAASVWLIGFIRVLRVLYRHLWKLSVLPDSDALIRAPRAWSSSCGALVISAAVAGSLVILMNYSIPPVALLVQSNTLDEIPGPLNWFAFATRICVVLSGVVVAGALLARPTFRNAGRWIGLLTSGMAMLIVPLNLVTFPSGLAAWILLTDPAVRRHFRTNATKPD